MKLSLLAGVFLAASSFLMDARTPSAPAVTQSGIIGTSGASPSPDSEATGTKAPDAAKGATPANAAQSVSAPSVCRDVSLGPDTQEAPNLEKQMDELAGVSVKAIGSHDLLLCGSPANVDIFADVAQKATGFRRPEKKHDNHVVRLFYQHSADELAKAINDSGGLRTPVKAVGNDLSFSRRKAKPMTAASKSIDAGSL